MFLLVNLGQDNDYYKKSGNFVLRNRKDGIYL